MILPMRGQIPVPYVLRTTPGVLVICSSVYNGGRIPKSESESDRITGAPVDGAAVEGTVESQERAKSTANASLSWNRSCDRPLLLQSGQRVLVVYHMSGSLSHTDDRGRQQGATAMDLYATRCECLYQFI